MCLKHTVQLLIHTLSDAYEHLCARTVVLYRDYMDRKLKNEYIYTTCENYEKVVGLSVRVGVCVWEVAWEAELQPQEKLYGADCPVIPL